MKISPWWLLAALSVGIVFTYIYLEFIAMPNETFSVDERTNYDIITLKLPRDPNPLVFGPKYWEAYERLTGRIPCPGCRGKAVPFIRFFHDTVNQETKKAIHDPDNFNAHIDKICKLQKA